MSAQDNMNEDQFANLMDHSTEKLTGMLRDACAGDQGKHARSVAEELAARSALPSRYLHIIGEA